MKVRYFEDTDTMLIEFRDAPVTQTRDLDENTESWRRFFGHGYKWISVRA